MVKVVYFKKVMLFKLTDIKLVRDMTVGDYYNSYQLEVLGDNAPHYIIDDFIGLSTLERVKENCSKKEIRKAIEEGAEITYGYELDLKLINSENRSNDDEELDEKDFKDLFKEALWDMELLCCDDDINNVFYVESEDEDFLEKLKEKLELEILQSVDTDK